MTCFIVNKGNVLIRETIPGIGMFDFYPGKTPIDATLAKIIIKDRNLGSDDVLSIEESKEKK